MLVDVREAKEWQEEGHFKGARLSPFLSEIEKGVVNEGLKAESRRVYVHCKMGGRAQKAATILKDTYGLDAVPIAETFDDLKNMEFYTFVDEEQKKE